MTELRTLGSTGLSVSPLIAGGNVFGWSVDEKASFAILDAFMAGGVTMIDTADVYSSFVPGNVGGESETILGSWMKARGNRSNVQIATKVGIQEINGRKGLDRATIAAGVELSLKRLQTDYIDLYFAHFDFPDQAQDETAEAFDRLIKAGKVRALGASNFAMDRMATALAVAEARGYTPYGALQPNFNLMSKELFPPEYRQFCIENNIGVVPYYALAAGFLTGKYRDAADAKGGTRESSVGKFFNARGDTVLAALDRVSAETGATLAQIAIAWIIATPGVTAPIASGTSVAQVESLLPAMTLELSRERQAALTEAAASPV